MPQSGKIFRKFNNLIVNFNNFGDIKIYPEFFLALANEPKFFYHSK